MIDTDTCYTILEVSVNADREEIKKAYRKMVKRYHPDNRGGDIEKFKRVQDAYNQLCRAPVEYKIKQAIDVKSEREAPKKKYFFFHIIDPLVRRMPAEEIVRLVIYSGNYLLRRQAMYVLYERKEEVLRTLIHAAKKDLNTANRAIAEDFLLSYLKDYGNLQAAREFWLSADVSEKYVLLVYLIEKQIKGYKNVVSRSIVSLPLFLQVKVRKYLKI